MKMKLVAVAIMGLTMSAVVSAADAPALNTDLDKLSYSVGIDLGKNLTFRAKQSRIIHYQING